MNELSQRKISAAGARESLVRHFAIEGLFGYRSLSLHSDYAATILIARNGAGKTTMLGALDAFLRGQFGRLAELDFTRIECQLRSVDQILILEKRDLDSLLRKVAENSDVQRIAKQHELDSGDLLFFCLWDYPALESNFETLYQHPIFRKIFYNASQTFESTVNLFKKIRQQIEEPWSPIFQLHSTIVAALRDIEIVYLPTYRRIELSLPHEEPKQSWRGETKSIHAKLGLNRRGLHAGDIQFGLADIAARLAQLNQEIIAESNQKYSEISANIIDDLISQDFEQQMMPSLDERPSRQELDIFFERMKAGQPHYAYNYNYRTPDFARIYSGNVPKSSEKFLNYFLAKLNTVIKKTRQTEQIVDTFVENCNRYLSSNDPSTALRDDTEKDDKELKVNRSSLAVSVWRKGRRSTEIPLDALSSGEKQMVSLFARLYLYPRQKLVLIDEPELSLSIDWQQKILPDIVNSHLCRQVIAITHSPFIFDNELDVFATPLRLRIDDATQPQ